MIKSFFVLVYITVGQPDYTMTPYLDDSMNSAMTQENCQKSADYLNYIDQGDIYYRCVQVYHTEKHLKG